LTTIRTRNKRLQDSYLARVCLCDGRVIDDGECLCVFAHDSGVAPLIDIHLTQHQVDLLEGTNQVNTLSGLKRKIVHKDADKRFYYVKNASMSIAVLVFPRR
jgi:hypothetical protein